MGWDILHNKPANAKKYLDREFAKGLVASSLVGRNEYYAAIRSEKTEEVFAVVVVIDNRNGEFAYTSMDEGMGPYFYNCPAKILKALTPATQQSAIEWREKCVKLAEMKRQANTLKNGDVVKFDEALSFGPYGKEDTFTACVHTTSNKNKIVRFQMEKNGIVCRITNWKTCSFTIQHKAVS